MAVFKNASEVYQCIGGLFDWAKKDTPTRASLAGANIVVRLNYTDPEAILTINLKEDLTWHKGDGGLEADVEFFCTADVGNRFWQGKVNLTMAMLKREITAKGALHKALKLITRLKPLYKQYPEILKKKGKAELAAV